MQPAPPPSQLSGENGQLFAQLDREIEFGKRIWEQRGGDVFAGDTNPATVRERIRQAILKAGLDAVIFGRDHLNKPETYAERFTRVFGEPFDPTAKPKRAKPAAKTPQGA